MAEEHLSVEYRGPALDTGEMDVRQLAPALIAIADLLHESQRVIAPEQPRVAVHVRALREGSFGIDLTLTDELLKKAVSIFSGNPTTAATNLLTLADHVTKAFTLLLTLNGRKPRRRVKTSEGRYRIDVDDDTSIEAEGPVAEMITDIRVRKAARDVIAPVKSEGIDEVHVTHRQTEVNVTTRQAHAFDTDDLAGGVSETTVEMSVSIAAISFLEGNKWRLSDGTRVFYATMRDDDFLQRVQTGEPFAANDTMRVRMTLRQTIEGGGLRGEYFVDQVLEHTRALHQPAIPFDDD